MRILVPDIPEAERTPLVRQLLDIIAFPQERIQQLEERVHQLEDEIARLKGPKTTAVNIFRSPKVSRDRGIPGLEPRLQPVR